MLSIGCMIVGLWMIITSYGKDCISFGMIIMDEKTTTRLGYILILVLWVFIVFVVTVIIYGTMVDV